MMALARHFPSIGQATVAFSDGVCRLSKICENLFVVVANDGFHIPHAAVTDFNGVTVKNTVQNMSGREFLIYQSEEFRTDVGGH